MLKVVKVINRCFVVYVLIQPVNRKEFETRVFPYQYDMLVYQKDNNYYVKNGKTGNIEYSSTDPLEVLNYSINVAQPNSVIIVNGTYDLQGRIWEVNKDRMNIFGYGAKIIHGGIKLIHSNWSIVGGFRFEYGVQGVPCIHRFETVYSTLKDINMFNVDIGIVEEADTNVNIVNGAYNIHIEGANTVGVKFKNSGKLGNNLNSYYGLFIHGGGVGVEFEGTDPNNPQNGGNQFFGFWVEAMQTGIKYYNGVRTLIYGGWFENNANYDIDIGESGWHIVVFGVLYPLWSPLKINNPYNKVYTIYTEDINMKFSNITPSKVCGMSGCDDSNPYIKLTNDLVLNIGRGYAFRLWQNGALDGELRIWFDQSTKKALIRGAVDPGIILGTGTSRVDTVRMYPHTSLPSSDVEGSMRLYYDGTSYKICSYVGGSWKCTQLS